MVWKINAIKKGSMDEPFPNHNNKSGLGCSTQRRQRALALEGLQEAQRELAVARLAV